MKKNFGEIVLPFFGYLSILILIGIIVIIFNEGIPLFRAYSLKEIILGKEWRPTQDPPLFGFIPSIISTIYIAVFSMIIAVPISLGSAIYLSKVAPPTLRTFLKPTIELLGNIPSVIYGIFALMFLGPLLQKIFHLPIGLTGLNASITLAIMTIPTITTLSEDVLSMTPKETELASYALGASHLETIFGISLPYAYPGIFSSISAGFGRAIGETMAVLLASGNSIRIPTSILQPMRPITATIALEMAETPVGSLHYNALFSLAIVLLVFVLIFNLFSRYLRNQYKKRIYG